MYAAVPRIIPAAVPLIIVGEFDRSKKSLSSLNTFASPKSSTLTLSSYFDRDVTIQLTVPGPVDLAHPTNSDWAKNFIMVQASA